MRHFDGDNFPEVFMQITWFYTAIQNSSIEITVNVFYIRPGNKQTPEVQCMIPSLNSP